MTGRRVLFAQIAALVWLWAAIVAAQSPVPRERAEAFFRAGAAAYAVGEYRAAIEALEAAYQLTPLPAIAFSLGQAERRQYFASREPAHLQRAIALFRRYVVEVQVGGRRADALDALAQLEPLAPRGDAPPLVTEPGPPRAQPTRLMVSCEAPGARIALDGAAPVPSPLLREVAPGKHEAQVEADGFFPARRELLALQGELILGEVTLEARPGALRLTTPRDADIYLDGVFVSGGGSGLRLELPAGRHRLAVAARGSRVAYRSVVLERGRTLELRVALETTRKRKAAVGLFASGGVVTLVSALLGGFSLREQNRAQALVDRGQQQNLTPGELDRYHTHAERRDLYRTLSVAGLGTAAGLFLGGLFLYALDRASVQDIRRDARAFQAHSRRATPSARLSLRVAPWLHGPQVGATASGRF